jgi:putative SOS response-associated peptidase YedK
MRQFHKPADEKRMIVILPAERYDDWLRAKPEQSLGFLQPYPADKLCAAAE